MLSPAIEPSSNFTAQRSRQQRDRLCLLSLLLIYLSIAAAYLIMTPPGEGVDEIPHFDYALYLRTQRELPVYRPGQPVAVWMLHHPPLYYALGSVVTLPFDVADRAQVLQPNPHFRWSETGEWGWNVVLPSVRPWEGGTLAALLALRLMNLLLGATALIFIYFTVMRLWPKHSWAALGATAMIGLNPSFLYMASTVHHDVLVAALFAAGIYWSIRTLATPLTTWRLLSGGAIAGALLLTKLSGLALLPVLFTALILRPPQRGERYGRLAQMAIVGAVIALLAGWWFVRNQILYGEPIGVSVYETIYAPNLRTTEFTLFLFVNELLAQFGRTFWGAFGYMHILLPPLWRLAAWIIPLIALIGWIVMGVRALRKSERPSFRQLLAWGILLLALAALFVFFLRFAVQTRGAGHGRYLLPVGATIGAMLIGGLNGYTGWRHQRLISLALVAIMAIYAVAAPLRYVWPLYPLPSSAIVEMNGATALDLRYEGGVILQGMHLSDPIVIPGQGLDVITYWAADRDAVDFADPYVDLSLVTDDGVLLGSALFWPEISTIPATWDERIIANRQSFYIPPGQLSGTVRVQMQIRDGMAGALLPVQGSGESVVTLAELLALGAVVEVDPSTLPLPLREDLFAGVLRLARKTLPDQVAPGGILSVELYWQVLAPIPADYTVFIHVLDSADQIVAQLDRPPGGGTSPTSTWREGQTLRDTYPVPLPADLQPGDYRVRMGLYTWPDLARQPVNTGERTLDDNVLLGSFHVIEQAFE
ncbi:MAG: DUF2142 domain-containing protein [Caldilineaceae bacterium]|nr:DUF2142 domain-containing protein [Caldilineaceae bacterium]